MMRASTAKYAVSQTQWSQDSAVAAHELALKRAREVDADVRRGLYDRAPLTAGIEQEAFVMHRQTGWPISVESRLRDGRLARPETAWFMVEYDSPVVETTDAGLAALFAGLKRKSRQVEQDVQSTVDGCAVLVTIGTQPMPCHDSGEDAILSLPGYRQRYDAMHGALLRENPCTGIFLRNPTTGDTFQCGAPDRGPTRTAATQVHLAFPTFAETLAAYNWSIALAGPLAAVFANSPYAGGIDTGLASSRLAILAQREQRRSRLARYARGIGEHYQRELQSLPALIELSDRQRALELAYGAEHISTRIILDRPHRTSRIEWRPLDAVCPRRAVQALLFLYGLVRSRSAKPLPSYAEALSNFRTAWYGLDTTMLWFGTTIRTRELVLDLLVEAHLELDKCHLPTEPLLELRTEILLGATGAEAFRAGVASAMEHGMCREAAIIHVTTKGETATSLIGTGAA